MVTHEQWSRPAHVGEWTLDLDNRRRPTAYIVCHQGAEVLRGLYRNLDETLYDEIVQRTGMSKGDAGRLGNQLAMKLASHQVTWEPVQPASGMVACKHCGGPFMAPPALLAAVLAKRPETIGAEQGQCPSCREI
jgi:hypothetical protein